MTLDQSFPDDPGLRTGEPGVGNDLQPPFVAHDDATRWLFSLNRFGIRPGLRRIERLLADLGHPERELKTFVIAGTNGKGSTTRILAALLQSAGYSVGTYTSPHLLNVRERILIDDRPIDADSFARQIMRLKPLVEKHEASWFEVLTAMAVVFGREQNVDFLCCETGLGGRLDATNALPAVATLLTSVGLDHQRILGSTREEIAAEKLGLLKRGTPLFSAATDDLEPQIFQAAVAAGSPCHFLDEITSSVESATSWQLTTRHRIHADLPLIGSPVLRRNMSLALLCVDELARAGKLEPPADTAAALRNTFLPGRWHQVLQQPDWIFDTAHNEQALNATLRAFLVQPCSGRRVVFFGSMRDKNLSAATGRLFADCDGLVAVPISLPRSRNHDELTELTREWNIPANGISLVARDIPNGLNHLADGLQPDDKVLVTGSCFLVAETLHHLGVHDLNQTRKQVPAGTRLAPFRTDVPGT